MNALRYFLSVVVVMSLFLAASPAYAIENEMVQGTIVSAAEGQVAFVDTVGAQRILTTTPDCRVLVDGRRATIDNLASGMAATLLLNRNMQCMQIVAASEMSLPFGHLPLRY
jgi:hypothetical protein